MHICVCWGDNGRLRQKLPFDRRTAEKIVYPFLFWIPRGIVCLFWKNKAGIGLMTRGSASAVELVLPEITEICRRFPFDPRLGR
jgi:hypothetical protein